MLAFSLARPLPSWLPLLALACSPAGGGSNAPEQRGSAATSSTAGAFAASGAGGGAVNPPGGAAALGGSAGDVAAAAGGVATAGGGAGGSGSEAGGAGGTAAPCGASSIFCSDFEADTIPSALAFYPEYLRATQSSIALDTSQSHRGQRALKVIGADFSQMLGLSVPSKFWGRVYLRSDSDIQEGHNTYVAAGTGTGDPNDGTYIRIGEHECQLELNRNTDDKELLSNGGQYECQGGVKLSKDTWYCLEFYFDGLGQETRVFVDGTEVAPLHTTDWGSYDYKLLKLGFEKYQGGPKTLWYDDLALAAERLHCL